VHRARGAGISAGGYHTCALLDDGSVRCWGYGADGQLGYGNTNNVGEHQPPGSVGSVDLGPGRTATAISASLAHTCAIVDNGSVRCWGLGFDGRLGYGNRDNVGDHQTPGSVGPVDLGPGRTAVAISAGGRHTCAILDDGDVRCWGYGGNGQLGFGNTDNIGEFETPGSVAPVDLTA
jgi:alpha-tubulin suppressor-like RCC1 family protein